LAKLGAVKENEILLPIGVSDEKPKKPFHRSIQQNPASSIKSASKAEKLQVAKSRGKEEAWTVRVDRLQSFRIRLTESGYAVILTWKDAKSGKWPERYCCYLSKPEWSAAKRQTLARFAALIIGKIEARKAMEGNDAAKLDVLIERIRLLTYAGMASRQHKSRWRGELAAFSRIDSASLPLRSPDFGGVLFGESTLFNNDRYRTD
jgi:hypothetical protein